MKKILIILIFAFVGIMNINAQPFSNISNGESGLSVRNTLNGLIDWTNDLGLDIEFSIDNSTWHYPWADGDLYMRTSGDYGVTWSDGMYIYYAPADINVALQVDYFFNNTASDIGGIYYDMTDTDLGGGESTLSTPGLIAATDDQSLSNFATLVGEPGVLSIPAGIFDVHFHAEKTAGTSSVNIYANIYYRASGGAETLITTTEISGVVTTKEDFTLHGSTSSDIDLLVTDRIVVKLLANVGGGSGATVALYQEGTTTAHLSLPSSTDVLSSIFVRQDGTKELTANWDAGDFAITVETLVLDPITAPAHAPGTLFYDVDDDEPAFYDSNSAVKINLSSEQLIKIRNITGSTINDFTPAYQTGSVGNRATIAKAQANAEATSKVICITTHQILTGANGKGTTGGTINNVDTDGSPYGESWSDGDEIFLSPTTAGWLTNVEPTGNNITKCLGTVLTAANDGSFNVKIDGANVRGASSSTDNALVRWDGTSGKRIQNSGIGVDDSDNITIPGTGTISTMTNATGDFLTAPTNGGLITQRTAAQVLSDIGAADASTFDLQDVTDNDPVTTNSITTHGLTLNTSATSFINLGANQLTDPLTSGVEPFIYGGSGSSTTFESGSMILQTRPTLSRPLYIVTGASQTTALEIDETRAIFSGEIEISNNLSLTGGSGAYIDLGANQLTDPLTSGVEPFIYGGSGSSTTFESGSMILQTRPTIVSRPLYVVTGTSQTIALKLDETEAIFSGTTTYAQGTLVSHGALRSDLLDGGESINGLDFSIAGTSLLLDAHKSGSLGASGYLYTGAGTTTTPTWTNPSSINLSSFNDDLGIVTKVGTPVDNQIGVWTGDGTLEGNATFYWASGKLYVSGIEVTGSIDAGFVNSDTWLKVGDSNPGTPTSNTGFFYVRVDEIPYFKNESNIEHDLTNASGYEKSSDPSTLTSGYVIWQSDGTGSGDDGDIMIKINDGSTTKTITLVDFSTF